MIYCKIKNSYIRSILCFNCVCVHVQAKRRQKVKLITAVKVIIKVFQRK